MNFVGTTKKRTLSYIRKFGKKRKEAKIRWKLKFETKLNKLRAFIQ